MASQNSIQIIIQAKDEASAKLESFKGSIDDVSESANRSASVLAQVQNSWYAFAGIAAAAGTALHSVTGFIGEDVQAANDLQAALTGLSSIARAYNVDQGAATKAAQSLASDGLMTVADAATGLKNLLASGFNLQQAITLMDRFKDSAAFNRQASLSFGDAIRTATEGIKNGNSILVDNAGVTKNLSIMLEEAGYSAQDLMKATTDNGVRQAIYNGIIKETNSQVGDASKLSQEFAGKQAQVSAQTEIMKSKIGAALQPALLELLKVVTPIISAVADWAEKHPKLTAAIVIGTTALLALITGLAIVGTAIATISPALPLLAAGFTALTGAISGTSSSLVALAIAGGPWTVLAAVAIAALVAIEVQANKTAEAVNAALNAQSKAADQGSTITDIRKQYEAGKINKTQETNMINAILKGVDAADAQANGHALGTQFAAGGMSLVGENGPELVQLPTGSKVTPARQTAQMMRGSGANVNVVQHIYNQIDMKRAIEQIGWKLATA